MDTGLKWFEVTNLFGLSQYSFDIDFDNSRVVEFLTGANGSGKTTILRILSLVATQNWVELAQLQFDKLHFVYRAMGQELEFSMMQCDPLQNESPELGIEFTSKRIDGDAKETEPLSCSIPMEFPYAEKGKSLIHSLSSSNRIWQANCGNPSHWADSTSNHLTEYEVASKYGGRALATSLEGKQLQQMSQHLRRYFKVKFIEADRLYKYASKKQKKIATVASIPTQLRQILMQANSDFVQSGEQRDLALLQRIIDPQETHADFNKLLTQINEHRSRLEVFGFYAQDSKFDLNASGQTENPAVLAILSEIESGLRQRVSYIERAELFQDLLADSFRNLIVTCGLKHGLRIAHRFSPNAPIDPCNLSSGQQQQILLYFNLIFQARDCLVLIDEPELSMDVDWQSKFALRLERIGRLQNCQFLLATHSHLMYSNHWESAHELAKL